MDFENHNSPIPGLTTKTAPDLHGVTFLIPQIQCYPGIPIYIYNAVSFFVRSNRPSFTKSGGLKRYYVEPSHTLSYPLNYSLWGKVANFTSSGMRSTYSLITSYQTSSEILTNKIVDPNLLKIWLRENNNLTRLMAYPCPYLPKVFTG